MDSMCIMQSFGEEGEGLLCVEGVKKINGTCQSSGHNASAARAQRLAGLFASRLQRRAKRSSFVCGDSSEKLSICQKRWRVTSGV